MTTNNAHKNKTAAKSAAIIIAVLLIAAATVFAYFSIKLQPVEAKGFTLIIDGKGYPISPSSIGIKSNFLSITKIALKQPIFSEQSLKNQIAQVAAKAGIPVQNYDINIVGTNVGLNLVNAPGKTLDQNTAYDKISEAIQNYQNQTALQTFVEYPTVTAPGAEKAADTARTVMAAGLNLSYQNNNIAITPENIGTWIKTQANGENLNLIFDQQKINSDLNNLTQKFDVAEQDMALTIQNGQASNFTPPVDGVQINTASATGNIIAALNQRQDPNAAANSQSIALKEIVTKAGVSQSAKDAGIKELIGQATTIFAGSTKNRVTNIKVGAQKLNYALIGPDQEFSTVQTIGDVDAAHGYLPELVIKGPNTVPDYGGGLCQISTTLFRSALRAGLPITERQNHSYRVSFYEKDDNGNYIGPGLDATIYGPHPDLKFKNNTGHWILLTDSVTSGKITFSLYGTSDGRTSQVTGPTILQTYQPKDDPALELSSKADPSSVKEVEFARTGARTIATYKVTYPDGTVKTQDFKSYYRPVDAKFEIGTSLGTTTPGVQ